MTWTNRQVGGEVVYMRGGGGGWDAREQTTHIKLGEKIRWKFMQHAHTHMYKFISFSLYSFYVPIYNEKLSFGPHAPCLMAGRGS
jgi:hypothetical protein